MRDYFSNHLFDSTIVRSSPSSRSFHDSFENTRSFVQAPRAAPRSKQDERSAIAVGLLSHRAHDLIPEFHSSSSSTHQNAPPFRRDKVKNSIFYPCAFGFHTRSGSSLPLASFHTWHINRFILYSMKPKVLNLGLARKRWKEELGEIRGKAGSSMCSLSPPFCHLKPGFRRAPASRTFHFSNNINSEPNIASKYGTWNTEMRE